MGNNPTLAAIGAAVYLASIAALCITPARAGIVEDPVTHWKTYVPDTGYPAPPQWQPAPIGETNTWMAPPASTPFRPQLQTTCYVIGNIITCN